MTKKGEDSGFINEITRISAGTLFKGTVISKSDLRIDGALEGKILLEGRLVLGDKATITGKVVCRNADIWGSVNGDICVKEKLEFKSISNMKGNIKTAQLQIEAGAAFNGTCQMIDDEFYDKYYAELEKED